MRQKNFLLDVERILGSVPKYLRSLSLQTRTKLRKFIEVFSLVAFRLYLKFKTKQTIKRFFLLRIAFPKNVYLVSFVIFSVNSAMNPIMVNV